MDEDINKIRLARLEQSLKDINKTVKRLDKSNGTVKSHINVLQTGIHKMEEPKTNLHNSMEIIKNNVFLLENI
jgi:chaperonin cofactor prefoldin